MSSRSGCAGGWLLVLAVATALIAARPVQARRAGIAAEGCDNCHRDGKRPAVRLLANPAAPMAGQSVAITIEVDAVNGSVGGFFFKLEGAGSLQVAGDSGIHTFSATQLGHSAPKAASGGVVRFSFDWTTPSTPGGAVLRAWGVSGNGNNQSSGDGAGEAEPLLIAYGCSGELYAYDGDGDGFGDAELGQVRDCSLPIGYAQRGGDCAEYDPEIHPEAPERCNDKDDDCDGMSDEQLPIGPQYADADGDGHGDSSSAEPIMDCSSPKGYSALRDDCNDRVASVHPDAMETCDYVDEDCDGRTDENARADCGVGWCRRLADSCNAALCTPGKPRAEECNAFDDDCDDVVDEDVSCGAGQRCAGGRCVDASAIPEDGGAPSAAGAGPDGSGGTGTAGSKAGLGASASAGTGTDPSGDHCAAPMRAEDASCAKDRGSADAGPGCSAAPTSVASRSIAPGWLIAVAWLLVRRRRRAILRAHD